MQFEVSIIQVDPDWFSNLWHEALSTPPVPEQLKEDKEHVVSPDT